MTQIIDSVAQQRGAEHGDVGPDHEQLDDSSGEYTPLVAARVGLDAAVEGPIQGIGRRSSCDC